MSNVILATILLAIGVMAYAMWTMYNDVARKLDALHKATCKLAEAQAKMVGAMIAGVDQKIQAEEQRLKEEE